jgi:hypothetical protein
MAWTTIAREVAYILAGLAAKGIDPCYHFGSFIIAIFPCPSFGHGVEG